ncbi:MAG: NUDIX domain-containing protein [Rhodobacteraceae bacterium]|nr:MAG: NUDIX domain-containing protein [Paracoccaceae bacterium]
MGADWPRLGALAVVIDAGRVLLALRGADKPNAGLWGYPGGHVEPGETAHAAAARELLEETCLAATPAETLMHLDAIAFDPGGALLYHYLLVAVRCRDPQGVLAACDDAAEVRWVAIEDVLAGALPLIKDVDTVLKQALRG